MSRRVLLQDLLSHRYLGSNDTWVTGCQHARAFDDTVTALLEGLRHTEPSQVVWCMQDPDKNLYMPVRLGERYDVFPCETCPLADAPNRPCNGGSFSANTPII